MNERSTGLSFNVDDIRRIRVEDDRRYSGLTPEEISRDIHERAKEAHRIMENNRKNKNAR